MQASGSRRFGVLWSVAGRAERGSRWLRVHPLALALSCGAVLMYASVGSARRADARPRMSSFGMPQSDAAAASEVVILVNLMREEHGLRPLLVNAKLVADARLHAQQIASTGVFAHVIAGAAYPTPDARARAAGYDWNALGENLAFGYGSAQAAVRAWMESPGHRANILTADYTETGVVLTPDRQGHLIYVQTFGSPE